MLIRYIQIAIVRRLLNCGFLLSVRLRYVTKVRHIISQMNNEQIRFAIHFLFEVKALNCEGKVMLSPSFEQHASCGDGVREPSRDHHSEVREHAARG